METEQSEGRRSQYTIQVADDSFAWYCRRAKGSRKAYRVSEIALLILSAAVPGSVAIAPGETLITAILGAMIVVVAGLRSLFHWQEDYLRFTQAAAAVETERRLYQVGAEKYRDAAKRDEALVSAISSIETKETSEWVKAVAPRPES